VRAAEFPPGLLEQLRSVFALHAGEHEVVLKLETRDGVRELRLGPEYRVAHTQELRAELDSLLGPHALAA
jgi:hypothetical protein